MSQRKVEVVAEPGSARILMRRIVDAPRSLVFDAFTKPELVTRWKGPRHFEVTLCEVDLRVGGKWRINYRMPNGGDLGFHGEFSEVVRPERVVRTFCFTGKPGKVIETFVFEEHHGRTLVTTISDHESVEARDANLGSGTDRGMEDAYDRLDELLVQLAA
jgi:uncharacterized protein YndB with AHSA1/START domain